LRLSFINLSGLSPVERRLIVVDCRELSADAKLALAMQISDKLDGTHSNGFSPALFAHGGTP